MIRQPFKARTPEELIALLSAVATAILAAIIMMVLYFGREIIIPIALAILLSFVLAPLVGLLQRVRIPRGLAVVSVVIIAFALIFAMGSLLATQLDATGRGFAAISIDDKRKDPVISRHHRRSGHARTRVRHVEGPEQGTGQAQGGGNRTGSRRKPEERQRHPNPFLWKSFSPTRAHCRVCKALFPRCFIRWQQRASSSFLSYSFCFSARIFVIG